MVEPSQSGSDPERSSRLFAKYSSILGTKSDGVECGATTASAGAGATAANTAPAPSGRPVPSSCSYASSSSSFPTPSSPLPSTVGTCPVRPEDGGPINPLNNIPTSLASSPTASASGSSPTSSASAPGLSDNRMTSSIPMSPPDKLPGHQAPGQQNWVYPSEQMFFNAMKRKGWDPQADDMHSVVAIHNTVNERAWNEVMAWERLHCAECPTPRLKRFQGRPSDISPKARLLNFVGFGLPFDRHDWIVDRCGREVRYVIDFYNGAPQPGGPNGGPPAPAAFFLDVRPALDTVEAAWDRIRLQFSWVTSGRWLDR